MRYRHGRIPNTVSRCVGVGTVDGVYAPHRSGCSYARTRVGGDSSIVNRHERSGLISAIFIRSKTRGLLKSLRCENILPERSPSPSGRAPAGRRYSSLANTQVLQPGPGRLASRGSRHVAIRTAQFAAKSSRAGIWDEVVGVHSSKSYQCGPSCQELVHSYASAPRRLRCMSSLICGSGSTW